MNAPILKKISAAFLGVLWALPIWAEEGDSQSSFLMNHTFSFFGTAGYSISDKSYAYTGIDHTGTFDAVSRIGAQLDAQITPSLGFILQGELLPASNKDKRWRPQLNWALLTYRPKNHWILRLGRARLPALLYTQNSNVGLSYVQSRLPQEVYGLSPTYDFNGLSSSYSWDFADGMQNLTWDVYGGMSNAWQRIWVRSALPSGSGAFKQGANHFPRRMDVVGTFLTWEDLMESNLVRAGVHYVRARKRGDSSDPRIKGFMKESYESSPGVFPPIGGRRVNAIDFIMFVLSADWHVGKGFYLTGEWANRTAANISSGLDTNAFYVQLRKPIGHLTPYVYWGWSQSDKKPRDFYKKMSKFTGNPRVDIPNSISADTLLLADQNTFALGASYDIGSNHRLKVQYSHVQIGTASSFVDAPPPPKDVGNKGINIFTASYNFLF